MSLLGMKPNRKLSYKPFDNTTESRLKKRNVSRNYQDSVHFISLESSDRSPISLIDMMSNLCFKRTHPDYVGKNPQRRLRAVFCVGLRWRRCHKIGLPLYENPQFIALSIDNISNFMCRRRRGI